MFHFRACILALSRTIDTIWPIAVDNGHIAGANFYLGIRRTQPHSFNITH